MPAKITVLLSGRGSNMQAIHKACKTGVLDASITHIVSNSDDATGLEYAAQNNLKTSVVTHTDYDSRTKFDKALINAIDAHDKPDLLLLAGFMRRLTSTFTRHYDGKLINIHPSLLPRYPGLNTHTKALQAKDRWHGCSVHFVNESLDGGPLIARGVVPVIDGDTTETLAARVLATEHRIFPAIAQLFLHGGLACQDSHVKINDQSLSNPLLYYYHQ